MNDHTLRRRIAEHEAAHAVIAQKMGLVVPWVSIELDLYGAATALGIPSEAGGMAVMADDPVELEQLTRDQLLAACVAMAAPSHIPWHRDTTLGRYAELEANAAYELGGRSGISWDEIYDKCVDLMDEHWAEVADLAVRLMQEGKVVFETV